ncbi:type II CRISPR-associated endonuclease Cas1 [Oligoflexaceae bacterium]|nr:type II CRISPR-associated endonuclease Cas1 [Oligoflexaceae bacterium]
MTDRRIIEISSPGLYLKSDRGQVKILKEKEEISSIPIEDIAVVIFSGYGQLLSTKLIEKLIRNKVVVVFCDSKFLPLSMIQPIDSHHLSNTRFKMQVEYPKASVARSWQNIIKSKITNQYLILEKYERSHLYLKNLVREVQSADDCNIEAKAARYYFKKLFGNEFKRRDDSIEINGCLNFTYAILRSALARALISRGFHLSYGIHHSNQFNNCCLVDDLLEPLRPFADELVLCLLHRGRYILTADLKALLTQIVEVPATFNGDRMSISNAIIKYSDYLLTIFQDKGVVKHSPRIVGESLDEFIDLRTSDYVVTS